MRSAETSVFSATRPTGSDVRQGARRRQAERRGRLAEWIAAAALVLKGYRILGRRLRSAHGEIDLIAVRGRRLAFIEVKQRADGKTMGAALSPRQADRLAEATERWLWRNPAYRNHRVGLDAVVLGPTLWPKHLPDALNSW